jgi:membrane-associated protein
LEQLLFLWDFVRHIDQHLVRLAGSMGAGLYALLFLIVFAETGLVVTPFLPGDSLLFAVGTLCAIEGSPVDLYLVCMLLFAAAVLGDAVNYSIGYRIGPKVFTSETSRWLNKKHLLRTQQFYDRYGGKAIIIARFVPIVRTFAPFVAGIGQMRYRRFFAFNVVGAALWVFILVPAGYVFADTPPVKKNFGLVIIAIIVLSVMPAVIEILREWRNAKKNRAAAPLPERG